MWIAKNLQQLTDHELKLFAQNCKSIKAPLSQTLFWNHPLIHLGLNPQSIFSIENKVSAIFFNKDGIFECTNGPVINQDNFDPSLLAQSINALVKINPNMQQIILRPRIEVLEAIIPNVFNEYPFPIKESFFTHSKVIDLQNMVLSSSIKNEIGKVEKFLPTLTVHKINHENLQPFYKELTTSYQGKNLFIPDYLWFEKLFIENPFNIIDEVTNYIVACESNNQKSCFLITIYNQTAFYLFSYNIRSKKQNLSLNLYGLYQFFKCSKEFSFTKFDFNGFNPQCQTDDPYYGVNQFKSKIDGKTITYWCPIFEFSNT